MTRIVGPTGSKRRRRFLLAPVFLVALAALFLVAGAQAVHDEGVFELEGNAVAGAPASDPANPQSTQGGEDWDAVFGGTSSAEATAFVTDTTLGGGLAGAGDSILFGGGTKDINDFPGFWAWKETTSTSVQDKDDIEHAYAAQYTVDKSGAGQQCGSSGATAECTLLYFGADRFSNSGDSVMGFWFFKQNIGTVGPDASGNGTFTGMHTARTATSRGDILVVSDFRAGGKAPSIQVYEWVDSGGSASTHLDQIGGSANPASCTQAPPEGGKDKTPVPPVGANDNFCATANQNVVTSPWPFDAKSNSGGTSGNGGATTKFGVAEFMEGGINLTALGLGDQCFSTFMAESRASHSVTSTLSDFALGTFGACTSGITTTPQTGAGTTLTSASIGTTARVSVRDHAVITVTGTNADFDGTVKFFLCGPLTVTNTNCSTGGVQIGDAAGETVSGTAGSATVNSVNATLTSVGNYCWRAEYSGDSALSIPASTDPAKSVADGGTRSECFSITPVTPTLTTAAGADVILGNPITDTATLSGTAKQPGTDGVGPGGTINATSGSQAAAGGSITWSVKGPDNCNASGLTVTGSPATVSGDNTYGPVSATPTLIGTYTFVASYSGNSPNTNAAGPSSCPPTQADGDEEVTVTGTSSLSTEQDWLPNDTATLTGDTNLNGTLVFELFTGDNCGATSGAAVTGQKYTITVTNAASGTKFNTSNTTFKVKSSNAGSFSWKVTYDDNNLQDPAPRCEKSTVSITD